MCQGIKTDSTSMSQSPVTNQTNKICKLQTGLLALLTFCCPVSSAHFVAVVTFSILSLKEAIDQEGRRANVLIQTEIQTSVEDTNDAIYQ